jgi:outer membrane protein insertion porin family
MGMMVAIAPRAGGAGLFIGIALCAIPFFLRATAPARAVVERIEIHGNTRTRDKTIRRALGISEGEPVRALDLQRAQRRVDALGFFTSVALRTRPGRAPGLVRVDLDVQERPGPSSGFSSAENFIGVCAIRQR